MKIHCFAVLIATISGCIRTGIVEEFPLGEMDIVTPKLDTAVIPELLIPSDIHCVSDKILLVNRSKNGNVFHIYDTAMNYCGAQFFYGNGPGEFSFVSGSTQNGSDTTLCLYTDMVDCTEFSLHGDSVSVTGKFRISDEMRNDVIVLNDSLVFYRTLSEDRPFGIYDRISGRHERYFGTFPETPFSTVTPEDRDNVCLSNSVYDKNVNRLFSFYESLPIVKIHDMASYSEIREVIISDAEKQVASLSDYYDDKSVVYFFRPIMAGNMIYVSFFNGNPCNGIPDSTDLLAMDTKGNFVARYRLDRYCPVYTVSKSGVFYGISLCGDEYVLCRADLVRESETGKCNIK